MRTTVRPVSEQCGSDRHRKLHCKEAGLPWDLWDEACKRRFRKPTDIFDQMFGEGYSQSIEEDHQRAIRIMREEYPDGCELCGEKAGAEMGEFYDPKRDDGQGNYPGHVLAHAQCGLDAGLEQA
jgi:hypothetical protein